MDELAKVHRVIDKALPGHLIQSGSCWIQQSGRTPLAKQGFSQAVELTGLVLTKLDGTAKGGVVIGICDEMQLPVRFIGIGEQIEDLRVFDPTDLQMLCSKKTPPKPSRGG